MRDSASGVRLEIAGSGAQGSWSRLIRKLGRTSLLLFHHVGCRGHGLLDPYENCGIEEREAAEPSPEREYDNYALGTIR